MNTAPQTISIAALPWQQKPAAIQQLLIIKTPPPFRLVPSGGVYIVI